ncbi:Yos1-domain-containing protein, partial [Morchella conica CCBAS932]
MFFGLMPLIKCTPVPPAPSPSLPTTSQKANTTATVSILLINAIAILSEDRFLARIGWAGSSAYANPVSPDPHSFGMQMPQDNQSIKFKLINLISSTRTLMRSKFAPPAVFEFIRR